MTKVIAITSGSTWTVPSDWNSSNNTIEVIGGGGGGGEWAFTISSSPYGGGGGGYSKISNLSLTPGNTVNIQVGQGGTGYQQSGSVAPTSGTGTWFNGTSLTSCSVSANGGASGVTGLGGSTTGIVGTTTYAGGGANLSNDYTGGGGAGGPNGTGASPSVTALNLGGSGGGGGGGGSQPSTASPQPGGNNYLGTGGGTGGTSSTPAGGAGTAGGGGGGGYGAGGATNPGAGGAGGAGTEWTLTAGGSAGSGGGGGSGGSTTALATANPIGGAGGLYGGGGGAGGSNLYNTAADDVNGGNGAQGVIIVTYTPSGGSTSPPFLNTDFPNPQVKATPIDLRTASLNLQPLMTAQGLIHPNSQTDWPVPPTAQRVRDLLTFTYYPQQTNAPSAPFSQLDWPLPPQAAKRDEPELRNFVSVRALVLTAKPFGQSDYPNPNLGRPYPLDARTFVQAPLKDVGTITLYLAATDAADTFAASIFSAQPVAPGAVRPSVGLQTGGGGFSSSQKDIPWNTAKDIVRRWYEAIGFRWLEERTLSDMRPSERAYFMDTVQQSPQIQYLLQNGYTMPMIYTLINQVKADNIDDDDGEAIALLLD